MFWGVLLCIATNISLRCWVGLGSFFLISFVANIINSVWLGRGTRKPGCRRHQVWSGQNSTSMRFSHCCEQGPKSIVFAARWPSKSKRTASKFTLLRCSRRNPSAECRWNETPYVRFLVVHTTKGHTLSFTQTAHGLGLSARRGPSSTLLDLAPLVRTRLFTLCSCRTNCSCSQIVFKTVANCTGAGSFVKLLFGSFLSASLLSCHVNVTVNKLGLIWFELPGLSWRLDPLYCVFVAV